LDGNFNDFYLGEHQYEKTIGGTPAIPVSVVGAGKKGSPAEV
jgi:hypothetical protein